MTKRAENPFGKINVRDHWYIVLPLALLLLLVAAGLINMYIKHGKKLLVLKDREIHGIVKSLEKVSKGSDVEVGFADSTKEKYYFHASWWFAENNIQPGDSVSKAPGTLSFRFYKKNANGYQFCCDKTID